MILLLSLFCPILEHLSQLISASTSLYHFCTYHNPVTFLFPTLSRIPSPNSTASFLPQTPYQPISALTPPPFPFLFLPSAINCIHDYYYLILSLLYICIGVTFFSSPGPTKGPCELLPSLGVRRLSSVNFSHFKLLLRNHLADWNRT